jgi:hypothetical protein
VTDLEEFTLHQLVREAEREVVLRRAVYPNLVQRRKMSPATALKQIKLMEAIAKRLRDEDTRENPRAWSDL